MVLSDGDIKKALEKGDIKITPAPNYEEQLGSCSIDLKLGNHFNLFNHSQHAYIDLRNGSFSSDEIMREVHIDDNEKFIMQPGEFVLAVTKECLELSSSLMGRIEGRSSLGRIGIIVHGTASVFDPGWNGNPVLELGNLGNMPVALYPGMRICSFTFEELSSPSENPYTKRKSSKYKFQDKPLASRIQSDT
ncbi:MAG: dCTP deaminase [Nitrospinae bacterium]|nr:dCTP deaminase [Nitrospinota bacterium]